MGLLTFQLTRPPAGRAHTTDFAIDGVPQISTHTSLAGRDVADYLATAGIDYISTHTPLAGRDGMLISWQ